MTRLLPSSHLLIYAHRKPPRYSGSLQSQESQEVSHETMIGFIKADSTAASGDVKVHGKGIESDEDIAGGMHTTEQVTIVQV